MDDKKTKSSFLKKLLIIIGISSIVFLLLAGLSIVISSFISDWYMGRNFNDPGEMYISTTGEDDLLNLSDAISELEESGLISKEDMDQIAKYEESYWQGEGRQSKNLMQSYGEKLYDEASRIVSNRIFIAMLFLSLTISGIFGFLMWKKY